VRHHEFQNRQIPIALGFVLFGGSCSYDDFIYSYVASCGGDPVVGGHPCGGDPVVGGHPLT